MCDNLGGLVAMRSRSTEKMNGTSYVDGGGWKDFHVGGIGDHLEESLRQKSQVCLRPTKSAVSPTQSVIRGEIRRCACSIQ